MFEAFTPSSCAGKNPRTVRLSVEELEGRCLLSGGFGPLGGITTGPDGEIWFLEKDRLGRLDPTTGLIQEFAQGINTLVLYDGAYLVGHSIAEGLDGSLWFLNNGQLTRFTPSTNTLGTINLSAGNSALDSITVGPDGAVWVLEQSGQQGGIARVDPVSGAVQDFAMGQIWGMASAGAGIGFGPDGKIWITRDFLPLEEMDPVTGAVSISNTNPFKDSKYPPKVAADGTCWNLAATGVPFAGSESIQQYNPSTGKYQTFPSALDLGYIDLTPGPGGSIYYTFVNGSNPDGSWVYYVGQFNPATGATQTFSSATPGQPPPGNPPPPASGNNVSAIAGINFTTAVASFTPQTPIASPGHVYQATISWGDGATSSLVLTVTKNGTYDVIAGHTYEKAGTYTIKVTVGTYNPSNPLGDNPITVFGSANVDPFVMW